MISAGWIFVKGTFDIGLAQSGFINSAMCMSELDTRDVGCYIRKFSSSKDQNFGAMVICERSYLSNRFSVSKVARKILTDSRNFIDCDYQLRFFFISSDELKRYWLIEYVG
jgi:hypothetical protein